METRLVQRPDHLEELDHRARPPMGEHQRKRVRVGRTGVQEVDAEPVDGRPELPDAVQPRLGPAPVVPIGPIGAQRSAAPRVRRLGPDRSPAPATSLPAAAPGDHRAHPRERRVERRDVGIWHVAMAGRLDRTPEGTRSAPPTAWTIRHRTGHDPHGSALISGAGESEVPHWSATVSGQSEVQPVTADAFVMASVMNWL